MRKIADYLAAFPEPDTRHGVYRLRIYEDHSLPPAVIVTNPTPGEAPSEWLSASAPRLAAFVARKDLPSRQELRWITPKPTPAGELELFESSTFAVIADGQVVYREPPRPEEPPKEPQAALLKRSQVEILIGQPLDG
jgi:hypothetical protein